ncbi:hypothetical protein B0T17DRAFT_86307 [Bombardia bombarda]|uniref:CCHC-type domain-containing protein n=1 Tax=Bombardia bombarda TaxID=252184 RepID=A0AA39XNQ8_9PEZI|nr:hypothetical protein B0T17DRAFT_86307 [Bombardia bombarda]
MATAAPGQSTAEQEPSCYNCGARGHWVPACPEPTRDVPAGLKLWHSQHQEHSQPSERNNSSSHDKKGPVVTRYPPPPGQATSITRYALPQPPPYPPAVPPPVPQAYPQPSFPPPPSFAGNYPPPPLPPYGQFPQSAPPPPPPRYGQQPPYAQPPYPPSYPPSGYYPNAPIPTPPSFPPGTYPPPQYGPPPPPPPPGSNHYPLQFPAGLPPPPPDFHYPPGQAPAYGLPTLNIGPYPPVPGWSPAPYGPPPPPPPANKASHNNHRGKHQKHQGSKRSNSHKDRHRSGNDSAAKTTPIRGERRHERQDNRPPQNESPAKRPVVQPTPSSDKKEDIGDGEWDPECEEDLKVVFAETKPKPADPVGIPLPCEYNENPTIPPAYNATCVKSAYFDEQNLREFVQSIRATSAWLVLKRDPIFKHYQGMIRRRFDSDDYEYSTYEPSTPPSPTATVKIPPPYKVQADKHTETPDRKTADGSPHSGRHSYGQHLSPEANRPRDLSSPRRDRLPAKRPLQNESWDYERGEHDAKRSRKSHVLAPVETCSRAVSPARKATPRSPSIVVGGDPWSPQAGETSAKASGDRRHLDVQNDNKSSSSRDERVAYSKMRHDSGYHSGQSQDRNPSSYRDDERDCWPSAKSHRRRRSPSRSRSRASSSERTDRGRSESPLTALEAELLGLDEPSDRRPKLPLKKPVKRVKVAAAFR